MERMLIGRLLAGAAVCSALTGLGGTEWKRNAGTLTRDAQDTHGGEPSYVMETKSVGDVAEIARRFDCAETNCLPAAWSVWCKVEAQKLVNVDIHIHFQFADGSWRWWVRRNYSWWEPGWHRIAGTFNPGKKPIAKVQCYAQVSRGAAKVTASDPEPKIKPGDLGPIAASKPSLMPALESMRGKRASALHVDNWLEAVLANDPTMTATNAEEGHRSTSICSLGQMCMDLSRGKKDGASVAWDFKKESTGKAATDAMMKPFANGRFDLRVNLADFGLKFEDVIKA